MTVGWLLRAWWVLFPSFGALAVALAAERTCGRAQQLLPGMMSNPALAWPVAFAYLAAHVWILAAYLHIVRRTQSLLPPVRDIAAAWPHQWMKPLLMLVLIAIEWTPVSLWRVLGRVICG